MCGITGIAGFMDRALLKKMTDVIEHRGPDDHGYYSDKDVSLGSRRLSIIDLKKSKQPVFNENKDIVIVYNGEIYNFKELREQLQKSGHKFSTDGDTEVIVHLYEEYGEDCVTKLNGMFAFAIWDMRNKKLFLARDRLGIKPLYYTQIGSKFLFGSEIK
ncbi:MAG: asparagine synthetase B, partial [Nanoarchaeota archaeon]